MISILLYHFPQKIEDDKKKFDCNGKKIIFKLTPCISVSMVQSF